LINIITHAFEVFKNPHIVLKDTHDVKRPIFELVPLVELVDTLGEHVDDLARRVKHVFLDD
jgi:hypothetical protein